MRVSRNKYLMGIPALAIALVAALFVPMAAFAQTPIPADGIITLATGAAADIVDPIQVTYIVIAAVGVSFGLWFVRRSLKLGR